MGEKSNYLPEYDCDRVDLRMWIQNKNPIPILPNVWIKERGLRMTNIEAARVLDDLVKQVFEEVASAE